MAWITGKHNTVCRPARTGENVLEGAQEAVLRQRRQRRDIGSHALVGLVQRLLAGGVVPAVQLEVEAREVQLPQHHARRLVRPACGQHTIPIPPWVHQTSDVKD